MRSAFISIALLLIAGGVIAAPDVSNIGIDAYLNQSTLKYDELWSGYSGTEWRSGYSLGISAEFLSDSSVKFVLGLRFVSLVGRTNIKPEFADGGFDRKHAFVSVPLSIRRYIGLNRAFFADLGAEFGLLTSAEIADDYRNEFGYHNDTRDILEGLHREHFGVVIGFGVALSEHGVPVALQLRYMHGLNGVADTSNYATNWNLRELGVGVTYLF